jgi:GNAT superfamily N-acetyltransferase
VLSIAPADLLGPEVQDLIDQLNQELAARYPEPGANHFRLDPEEVGPGRGAFLLARWEGQAVGCGALRILEPGTAELKRMFALPSSRRRGIGRAILGALEDEARRLGVARLVLETGIRQPEAIALYRAHGFSELPPFGEYVLSAATSVCMTKDLSA